MTVPTGHGGLVVVNGRVTTLATTGHDGADATAVGIAGDRIVAIGTDDHVRAIAGADARVIDARGRRIVPGLVDSHIHMVRAGLTWHTEARWDTADSIAEGLRRISAAASRRGNREWVRVLGGWAPGQLIERRWPTREELDEAAPDNPVYVQMCYGDALLNTAALDVLGIGLPSDEAAADLVVDRDGATGRPTGRVRGKAALDRCTRAVGRPNLAQQTENVRAIAAELLAYGLTGVADLNGFGTTPETYRAIFDVWRGGNLKIRTRLYLGPSGPGSELGDFENWARFVHPQFGDGMLRFVGFGEQATYGCMDLEGLNADYRATDQGRKELLEVTRLAVEHGWPMQVHAVLDDVISVVLDAWEIVNEETAIAPLRFSICHADAISGRNIDRSARLGIGLALQNRLVYRAADSAEAWGDGVAIQAPPMRDILDAGIPVGGGTDATVVSSPNPWLSLWWFVSGGSLDGFPSRTERQRVSRLEALRIYTLGSCWFSFEEGERGSLEPGKLADLAILSQDYFEVPEGQIPEIRSVMTVVDGTVVHDEGVL